MDNAQKMQLLGIITALITSTVSIIISAVSLYRTRKATERSVRAYLSLIIECFDFGIMTFYISVKNYGKSAAKIIQLNYDPVSVKQPEDTDFSLESGLKCIEGATIFPGQAISFPFVTDKISKNVISVTYTYETCGKKYTESASIDIALAHRCCKFRSESMKDNYPAPERNISYSLQEIAERITFK